MALLDELKDKYAVADLENIFAHVGINSSKITPDRLKILKEVNLAQWLLESARGTSLLATTATNFAGLKWRLEMDVVNSKTGKAFATKIDIKVPSEPKKEDFCQFENIDAFIIGYWKFLSRPVYAGLEDNTNTPENFLGFLQGKGYSTDPDYVKKVMNLVPEAQGLLLGIDAGAVVVEKFNLLRAPEDVVVGQAFIVEGVANASFIGKTLEITIDNKFSAPSVTVGAGGKWEFFFVFNTAGNRTMAITSSGHTIEIKVNVKKSVSLPSSVAGTGASSHPDIKLYSSVGVGGLNKKEDIKAVIQRLHKLGYTWAGSPGSDKRTTGLDNAIKLFQSIIAGFETVRGDGRIDVDGFTHKWLQAANAPMWVLMPKDDQTISFKNGELAQTGDNHDFGSNWLAQAILDIAKDYHRTFRSSKPVAAPFAINDVSIPHGGDTPDHSGHETGLMCDVFLPRKDGGFGGTDIFKTTYDQVATRALLESIRKQKLVNKNAIFFNDPDLISARLCAELAGHHHHIHFEISPPPMA